MMKQFLRRNFSVICICLGAVTVLLFGAYLERTLGSSAVSAGVTAKPQTGLVIILDAGHGGIDGGAVSKDGTVEKDINLAITLKLRDLLSLSGYQVVLTRDTDRSIHSEGAVSIRDIKRSDLQNRLELTNTFPNGIFVSIHQNYYTESKYSGAQFFYSPNHAGSQVLAETLQSLFREKLQPQNERQIKPAGKDLYLMTNIKIPAVLAECGFLSNVTEAALLTEEEYQQKIAFVLYEGLLSYLRNAAQPQT